MVVLHYWDDHAMGQNHAWSNRYFSSVAPSSEELYMSVEGNSIETMDYNYSPCISGNF